VRGRKLWIKSPDEKFGLFDFGDELCPWCGTELSLKNYDDERKIFSCPSCGAQLDRTSIGGLISLF